MFSILLFMSTIFGFYNLYLEEQTVVDDVTTTTRLDISDMLYRRKAYSTDDTVLNVSSRKLIEILPAYADTPLPATTGLLLEIRVPGNRLLYIGEFLAYYVDENGQIIQRTDLVFTPTYEQDRMLIRLPTDVLTLTDLANLFMRVSIQKSDIAIFALDNLWTNANTVLIPFYRRIAYDYFTLMFRSISYGEALIRGVNSVKDSEFRCILRSFVIDRILDSLSRCFEFDSKCCRKEKVCKEIPISTDLECEWKKECVAPQWNYNCGKEADENCTMLENYFIEISCIMNLLMIEEYECEFYHDVCGYNEIIGKCMSYGNSACVSGLNSFWNCVGSVGNVCETSVFGKAVGSRICLRNTIDLPVRRIKTKCTKKLIKVTKSKKLLKKDRKQTERRTQSSGTKHVSRRRRNIVIAILTVTVVSTIGTAVYLVV